MICKHCGTSIAQGSAFCPSCGKPQGAAVQQPQVIGVQPMVVGVQPMVVVQQPKSLGLAIALTIFFGPLGLLYATVKGGLIMIMVALGSLIVFLISIAGATADIMQGGAGTTTSIMGGFFGLIVGLTWPGSIAWACYAVTKYNDNVRRGIMNGDVN